MAHYTQINEKERVHIYNGLVQKKPRTKIAEELGRHRTTIWRERKRNSDHIGYLYPRDAQKRTEERKAKHGSKAERNQSLKEYIIDKLKQGWSPEIIAGRWKKEHPEQSISTEAIYQFIYKPKNKKLELWKFLIKRKKKRGLVRKKRAKTKIKNRVSVHERPKEIDARQEFGHYESDLFFNQGSKSANVLIATERVTRKAVLIKQDSKNSTNTINSLKTNIEKHAKSCTFDNGMEFAEHEKLGIQTFFCDAYSPWQKGSVENFIKLVREHIPFNVSSDAVTQELLDFVADKINNRPRKILGFLTANELFELESKKVNESRVKPALPAVEVSFNVKLEDVALHI